MSVGDLLFLGLTAAFVAATLLLSGKLFRILRHDRPYWIGTSPWRVDKTTMPGEHIFHVAVFGIAAVVAGGLAALFLYASFATYF